MDDERHRELVRRFLADLDGRPPGTPKITVDTDDEVLTKGRDSGTIPETTRDGTPAKETELAYKYTSTKLDCCGRKYHVFHSCAYCGANKLVGWRGISGLYEHGPDQGGPTPGPNAVRHNCRGQFEGMIRDSKGNRLIELPASPAVWVDADGYALKANRKDRDARYKYPITTRDDGKGGGPDLKFDDAEEKAARKAQEEEDERAKKVQETMEKVRQAVAEAKPPVIQVVVKNTDGSEMVTDVGQQHEKYPLLMSAVGARIDTFLVGPAGTGKTAGAAEAAKALGLPFYAKSLGPATQEFDLFGFTNANGDVVPGAIRAAFENGGIMILDEMDAASPEALTALNTALANKYAMFPDGMIERHPDCIFVATGNTFGKGGNWVYKRGEGLDAATLDRFATIFWGPDTRFERALAQPYAAQNPDDAEWIMGWTEYVQRIRDAAIELEAKHVISFRAIERGIKAHLAGIGDDVLTAFSLSEDIPNQEWKKMAAQADLPERYDGRPRSMTPYGSGFADDDDTIEVRTRRRKW